MPVEERSISIYRLGRDQFLYTGRGKCNKECKMDNREINMTARQTRETLLLTPQSINNLIHTDLLFSVSDNGVTTPKPVRSCTLFALVSMPVRNFHNNIEMKVGNLLF